MKLNTFYDAAAERAMLFHVSLSYPNLKKRGSTYASTASLPNQSYIIACKAQINVQKGYLHFAE
jgi:hypothetical protein